MKIQGEFAAERTTRDQADQGIYLGLFQHRRRPGEEPSLGTAVPLLPVAIRKWSGRPKIWPSVMFRRKNRDKQALNKYKRSEDEMESLGVTERKSKKSYRGKSTKQGED